MIDGKRALLCGYVFMDKECAFAPRGVVLVFITVVPLLCGQWSRCAENCGNVSQLQFLG